jgi:septal ring factor EnvC (AmiA/AmiB activator)
VIQAEGAAGVGPHPGRRRLGVLLALLALLSLGAAAAPSRDDQRLEKVRQHRQRLEHELLQLRSEEKSLLGDVERLELEIRIRNEQLQETRLVLQRTNTQMDEAVAQIRDLERAIDETRPVLRARARALYKLGELSYLRLLLSVERPADMLRGYRFVAALARRDNQRFAAFRRNLESLARFRLDLEKRTEEALTLRAELQRARRRLAADRERKTKLLTSIVEKKEIHAAYLEELKQAEERLEGLLEGLVEGEVSVPITVFKGSLPWPADGRVRVPFGRRKHPRFDTYTVQNGIEIAAAPDSEVRAVHEGTVVFADRFRGYGLMVVVDHGGKHHSLYAHLAETLVQPGQRVVTGQTLGTVAAPGLEDRGLYFEIRFRGKPEDPADWLKPRS